MRNRQLSNPVREIGYADLLGSLLEDVVHTAEGKGREVFAVGVAGPVLDRARHPNPLLDATIKRSDFLISHRPVDINTVQAGRLEIDLGETRRRPAPEVALSTGHFDPHPLPIGAGSVG